MRKKPETTIVELPNPKKTDVKPMCPVTGSRIDEFTHTLCRQAINSVWTGNSDSKEIDTQIGAAVAGLLGVRPKDEVEGMLAAQMVAAHNASMECFRRAMNKEQSFQGREMNLNQANKLSRTYATMMEALQRYRGKGQQKMTVEHVHVHAGGQAIVGQLSHTEGGGVIMKMEDQPDARPVENAPMPEMRSPNKKRKSMPIALDA